MNNIDDFDAMLAARFEREHPHVSPDAFVAATMQRIRATQRRAATWRAALRVAALAVVILASPWLISGAEQLNETIESSFTFATGLPGIAAFVALAAAAMLALRLRSSR